jgi:hypothetical protein
MKPTSFFDKNYQTPSWLKQKTSRRNALKSAAGAFAISAMPSIAIGVDASEENKAFQKALSSEPWLTLDSVLQHLLPSSASGPGAKEIQATQYLYNLVYQQPTPKDEIDFVYQGVGWLNGYAQGKAKQNFPQLTNEQKEEMLRAISRSPAGENWLSMLMSNMLEAMLSPPAYGGNPNGIGWQWLEHQAGFPLPKAGQRYYELPKRIAANLAKAEPLAINQDIYAHKISVKSKQVKGARKA